MGIVGDVPESGVRVAVERLRGDGPPWVYRGQVVTPASSHEVTATVSSQGEVAVELPPGAPPSLEKRVRLVLRSAWKHGAEDGSPPPWRVARWRASE